LIGVRTARARRTTLAQQIRLVGIVRADETRLADVNLKVEGWIRDLYVDYTGQAVKKGDPLFSLYSPELLTAANEYLLAVKARDEMQSSQIPDARQRADQLVVAARRRLQLSDFPLDELAALDARREAPDTLVFKSPADGVVIDKQALKGSRVMPGQTLYKIADLSKVWVEADIYEAELPLVKNGGRAIVTLDAYPGERFTGQVLYIYPYVDEKTRTNKVRFAFMNGDGRLKPGMYANVEIGTAPGTGIVVPTDAVLDSGSEQIVFVSKGDGHFEPRRVKAGRRLGSDMQILEGLKDGDEIATGATFFLDSESQLRASLQGFDAPPDAAPNTSSLDRLDITLRSQPDPPKAGENQLEVTVKDPMGKPVDGADVTVQFFMAAMPTMGMPAMRNEVKLPPAGGGVYRGTGQVMTPGQWETTVTVTRGGQRLGSKQLTLSAR
jgi:Cu(I)/Ag(I) efflux system membrane fusion protein/cobalt-zinc-cadmium efflux system membrane fusion protein